MNKRTCRRSLIYMLVAVLVVTSFPSYVFGYANTEDMTQPVVATEESPADLIEAESGIKYDPNYEGTKQIEEELISKRGQFEKHFVQSDGSVLAVIVTHKISDKAKHKGAGKIGKLDVDALKKIGVTAENSGIRKVTGNADDAYTFFKRQVNQNTIKEVKPGTFIGKDSNGLTFTYRASSKSGPPTIDVNGVSGLRKIKFIDGSAKK